MEFCCSLYPYDRWNDVEEMARAVRAMDSLGFHGLSLSEHIAVPLVDDQSSIGDSWPDVLVLASYFAGQTSRLRFLFYAMVAPYRNPVILAKQIATLDQVSGGRTMFTFASGWLDGEFDALGVPMQDRGERLDEYIRAMQELWTSDRPSFAGKYVSFSDIVFEPKCVQQPHPPLLIGGSGRRPLDRVLELGDGWAPMLGSADDLGRDIAQLRLRAAERGRNPDDLKFMFSVQVGEGDETVQATFRHVGDEEMVVTGGSDRTATAVSTLQTYADRGVTHMMLVFGWETADDYIANLEWLAADVVPQVAQVAR